MDLSVVIACKNEASRIGNALESLALQSWGGSWEVVIADNGSTDATVEIAATYSNSVPRLVIIDASARPGYAYARNIGVAGADGAKILFVDGDDEVGDGYVAAMAAALDEKPLVCARLGFDKLNEPWVREVWGNRWQQTTALNDFRFLPFAGSGTLGITRRLYEEMGGFRHGGAPSQFEEADLCWRIQLGGYGAPIVIQDAVLHYRLPGTVRGWYRRGRNYARGQQVLYRAYRDRGMPPPATVSVRHGLGAVRRIRRRRDLARAALVFGRLVGQRGGVSGSSGS